MNLDWKRGDKAYDSRHEEREEPDCAHEQGGLQHEVPAGNPHLHLVIRGFLTLMAFNLVPIVSCQKRDDDCCNEEGDDGTPESLAVVDARFVASEDAES